MRVALTGATGFLGGALLEALLRRGDEVVALGRRPLPARQGLLQDRFVAGEPLDAARLHGAQAVIHLAGEPVDVRWTDAAKRRIEESRVGGTARIAEAARSAGTVKTLLLASAIGFYGDRGDEELDEGSARGQGFLAEVTERWEQAAAPAREAGIRTVPVRIGVVLHRAGGALARLWRPFQLGVGGPLGDGRQWMSWVHRDDVVGLFLHALTHSELSGPLNATSPNPARNVDFARALGRALHRPALLPAPKVAMKLVFGEMASMVLGGQKVHPRRALESHYRFLHPDLDEALATAVA